MITLKEYIDENAASDSLKAAQKQKPTTTAEVETLAAFMKLAPEHKARTLEWLNNSLADAIPDGTAEKNRKSQSKYVDQNKKSRKAGAETRTNEELSELMSSVFPDLTPELVGEFREIWAQQVAQASVRDAMLELFEDNPYFKLLFNEPQMDMARLLTQYIEELENAIDEVEKENLELARNIVENQGLFEEALYAPHQTSKKPKRSLDMEEHVDEANRHLFETEQQEHLDPAMRARVRYLEQTTRNEVTPAAHLLETWEITKQN
jgi:hypothetical protein